MSELTIYHNPRCSKSRQTLQLLQDKGLEPVIVEYLKDVPNAKILKAILAKLAISAHELIRNKETLYKELGLSDSGFSEAQYIKFMIENPKLIERPIVVNGNKAAIGRPPENVETIL